MGRKKTNGWRTGIPSDGHTILLDHHDRAFAVNETSPLRFDIVRIPDPPDVSHERATQKARRMPATNRHSAGVDTESRRKITRRTRP